MFFWFAVLTFAASAWCAATTSLNSFFVARILNGLFLTVAQGVSCYQIYATRAYQIANLTRGGPMIIGHMFFSSAGMRKSVSDFRFDYECDENQNSLPSGKINIWSAFGTVSPYLGPLLAAFMIIKFPWHWLFWMHTA